MLFIRNNDRAKRYVEKLQKRMNKPKALSALAHKLGRAVYFMLKDKRVALMSTLALLNYGCKWH